MEGKEGRGGFVGVMDVANKRYEILGYGIYVVQYTWTLALLRNNNGNTIYPSRKVRRVIRR